MLAQSTKAQLAHVFPRFSSATCNFLEFWLVHCIVFFQCYWLEWSFRYCGFTIQQSTKNRTTVQTTFTAHYIISASYVQGSFEEIEIVMIEECNCF